MSPFTISTKPIVFICSPFSGDTDRNINYAQAAMRDSLDRVEAPYVPHLLYPQVFDDENPEHRDSAILSAFAFLDISRTLAVYQDFGISRGMKAEIERAKVLGKSIQYRNLPDYVAD